MFSGIVWILFFISKIYVGFVNTKKKFLKRKLDFTGFAGISS
jgi:hypothetical protein